MSDEQERSRPRWRQWAEVPVLVVAAFVLALGVQALLMQAFFIPSGSMTPTLEVGDRVLVEKLTYRTRDPARGEIIVFRSPGAGEPRGLVPALRSFGTGLGIVRPDGHNDLIKRVAGLPGETIEVDEGIVLVDGRPLEEPYIAPYDSDFGPVEVPEGQFFMLGDNRANSDDSRFSLGTVPRERIVGRAFTIMWPPSRAQFGFDRPSMASP